jgi:hypothetical protein
LTPACGSVAVVVMTAGSGVASVLPEENGVSIVSSDVLTANVHDWFIECWLRSCTRTRSRSPAAQVPRFSAVKPNVRGPALLACSADSAVVACCVPDESTRASATDAWICALPVENRSTTE